MNRRDFLIMGSSVCLSALAPQPVLAAPKPMRYKYWKTLCVGRYLVDAPEDAILSYYPIFGDGILKKMQGTPQDAKKMAEDKIQELKATQHETKGNSFIQAIPLANGGVLVQGWRVTFNANTANAYLYIPVQTHKGSFVYSYTTKVRLADEQQTLQDLIAFGSSFKALPQDSIPKEAGFCFDDIMILNVPRLFTEQCGVKIEDPRAKGLTISFRTTSTLSPRNWLTQIEGWEKDSCEAIQAQGKCKRLRFGKHKIGSIQGEEICLTGNAHDGKYRTYIFEWDNPGIKENKTSPNLRGTMLYQGVPSQYPTAPIPFSSDEEALEVWDKFVGTIRIRPTE